MPNLNLDLDYFDHPKTVRLVGLLGVGAESIPIRLWCYCGKFHAEDGSLAGYSSDEIEAVVKWHGTPGAAVGALVKTGFLEHLEDGYHVHDWSQVNGHIAAFKQRAKAGAKAKWDKQREYAQALLKHEPSIEPCSSNATSNATSNALTLHCITSHGSADERAGATKASAVTEPPHNRSSAEIEALAQKVMDAYPLRAKKDGRAINRTIHDQDLLISKIRKHPDFEWERAARLMNHIDTPPNMTTWLLSQPDKVQFAQNARLEAEARPGAEGSGTPYVGGRKKVPVR